MDRRKAKRLAHRVRQAARQHGLPRVIHTSPLQRCRSVGRILQTWGWQHHIDASLVELDFGAWDGKPWGEIPRDEIDAWVADFSGYQPGGGESLRHVLQRAQAWQTKEGEPVLVIAHAGWMLARQWVNENEKPPVGAHEWPKPPAYGQCWPLR